MNLQHALDILALLEKVATILALIIGGLFAYYKFFRGRTFWPRLEAQINGQLFADQEYYHLLVKSSLKNVGLSKVDLNHDASGIRIYSYGVPPDVLEIESADWEYKAAFPVFEKHRWIEAGETIEDEALFSVKKGNQCAFRAVLRIVARKLEWNAESVVNAGMIEIGKDEHNKPPEGD